VKKKNTLDVSSILRLFTPPFNEQFSRILFTAFAKGDDYLDLPKFIMGIDLCYRGSKNNIWSFLFKAFDKDKDGKQNQTEFGEMLTHMMATKATMTSTYRRGIRDPEEKEKEALHNQNISVFVSEVFSENKEFVTEDEFLQWADANNKNFTLFFILLKQAININLLKPDHYEAERNLVERTINFHKEIMSTSDLWFVISAKWWHQWLHYTSKPGLSPPGSIDSSDIIMKRKFTLNLQTLFGLDLRLGSDTIRMVPKLTEGQEYFLVPEELWKAMTKWYGCSNTIERKVISEGSSKTKLSIEVYPLNLVFKIEPPYQPKKNNPLKIDYADFTFSKTTLLSDIKRKASVQLGINILTSMSRIRLWSLSDDNATSLESNLEITLEEAGINDGDTIIIERQVNDKWPRSETVIEKPIYPITPGIAGLRNLGNTCFMNSSLQCLANTPILLDYFISNRYIPDINRDNPLGMNGHVAKEYGALVHELWPVDPEKKSITKNYIVVPKDLKHVIGIFAPQFNGFQQHDAQEFLAFLLDGLHEDLNRILQKPFTQNPDYQGQPDQELAKEFFENYLKRNRSIVVELFAGQLKSTIRAACGRKSVTFDPFTFLSLPLPIDDKRSIEIFFFHLASPKKATKISVLVDREEGTVIEVLKSLSGLVGVDTYSLLLVSVKKNAVATVVYPWDKLSQVGDIMYAYELIGVPKILEERITDLKEGDNIDVLKEPIPSSNKKTRGKSQKGKIKAEKTEEVEDNNKEHQPSDETSKDSQPQVNTTESSRDPQPQITVAEDKPSGDSIENFEIVENTPVLVSDARSDDIELKEVDDKQTSGDIKQKVDGDKKKKKKKQPVITTDNHNDIIFIRVLHRKVTKNRNYFVSPYRSTLVSAPSILSYKQSETTKQHLYALILKMFDWMIPDSTKSSSNVTIAPDTPKKDRTYPPDHIETLTTDYPFILRYVNASGTACSRSPWYLFNIGTPIVPNNDIIDLQSDETIAIDWKLNVLKPIRIKMNNWFEQHPSCEENWEKLNKPISLDQCMNWFTQEEDLGDELYCSECKKPEKTKKKNGNLEAPFITNHSFKAICPI
jgi:ubiquitin carboxyl-terminal hydrolase 6/32